MFPPLLAACCFIAGSVHTIAGAPLAAAQLTLRSGSGATQTLIADANGRFKTHADPGTYRLTAATRGFSPLGFTVKADRDLDLDVMLEALDSPKLRQIGSVTADGRLTPIQGTIPAISISRAELDAAGDDRIVDGLALLPGATFARPDGGASSAIAVVALRGPDPSESLVTLDGQLLSDGNTGDVDLSRFPVSAFSAIDVTEGLGPQDSNGSNTFGGAIDLISLRPTKLAHESLSFSGGSFGRSEGFVNATGTVGKLGYAGALDDQNETGYTNQTVPLDTGSPTCSPCATHVGSSVAAHTALGTLTWSFSQNADVTARVFALGDDRDQSSAVTGITSDGHYQGPGGQTFAQSIRAYQLRGRTPLGAGELIVDASLSDDSVDVEGGAVSPYDLVHVDKRYNGGLTWQRSFATSQFAVGGYTRYESLDADGLPRLGQTIDVLYARGGFEAAPNLRLDAGAFESRYTTFGSNLDGRFSAIYAADAATSIRFSLGTGFRAPLLIERYAFPYAQLALDANNVFVGQGSTGERPEHATEYELGASHEFSPRSTLDVSLYRTSLRDPVEVYYPLAAVAAGTCANNSAANPNPACVSYQSNVGNAVYQGAELRYSQLVPQANVLFTGRYGINVAYPKDLSAQFSNPTSGGTLVEHQQFPGIPQQQGSFEVSYDDRSAWHAAGDVSARGNNNELSQGPFAIVNGLVGRRFGSFVDLSLAGTNLFNTDAGHFTRLGAGEPYRGVTGQDESGALVYGSLATDALVIEPAALRLILTLHT